MQLRQVQDDEPGFGRRRAGRGFVYLTSRGAPLRDRRALRRIESLVIPPAWRDVWICRDASGHIQATGFDEAGRKQYIYHPIWRERQERAKFDRLVRFGEALPAARRRARRDLRRKDFDRRKVLAAMLEILDRTCIRVGSEEYARENGTYGIATLRSRHLTVEGESLIFEYRGKSGKEHVDQVTDGRLARIVAELDDLPGYEIFKYRQNGDWVDVKSDDLNAYIKEVMGEDFSAKDFRTWTATVAAATALAADDAAANKRAKQRMVTRVVKETASVLGNTPAVCRSSYIDPRVIEHYLDGAQRPRAPKLPGLSAEESAVLALLKAAR